MPPILICMEKLLIKFLSPLVQSRGLLFALVFLSVFACKHPSKETTSEETIEISQVRLLENPSLKNSSLPRLFSNGNELYFSWVTDVEEQSFLNFSKYSNGAWSPSEEIISGTDWFVNWADFPQIVENNGNILSSFLQKSANGTYTYDVKLNLYNDATKTWKRNFILHNDGTQSEHGFVSIKPYVFNSFFITWLDGRNTGGGHDSHSEHGDGAMTLRGAIVFEDGTIDYDTLLDEKVCDCCNTATAIGPNDELIVAYRDRTDEEIRDISIKRWVKEEGWLPSIRVAKDDWKIAGCPVNGPAIDIFENTLGITWYTGKDEEGKVFMAFSDDKRESFGTPIRIDTENATGRVDMVMLSKTEAIVLWMEPQGEDEVIQLMKVHANGTKNTPVTISKTSAARASGFPQLEKVGNMLFVAWTVTSGANSKIEMASVSLEHL